MGIDVLWNTVFKGDERKRGEFYSIGRQIAENEEKDPGGVCDLREHGLARSKVMTLNFQRANFQLFKDLVDKIPWNAILTDKGAEQSWQPFKNVFLRAQEQLCIPLHKKSSVRGRKPVLR